MIHLTRINHVPLVLNADLIEHIESTPDTVITLTNAQKFMVLEPADEVIARVIAFRRSILGLPGARNGQGDAGCGSGEGACRAEGSSEAR